MGFVKTSAELEQYFANPVREFPEALMLGAIFNADAALCRSLLPPPLELPDVPGGLMFLAEYGANNLGAGYREAALFLRCRYQDRPGSYCLSMPIDSAPDRLHNGRDIYGFPKKAATIHVERDEHGARGWVERLGVRFVELDVTAGSTLPDLPPTGPTYLFKASPRADLRPGFDGPVLLVAQQTEIAAKAVAVGPAQLTLRPSAADPWHELQDAEIVMGFVLDSHNRMLPGDVLGEVDGAAYLPYYFKMGDFGVEEA